MKYDKIWDCHNDQFPKRVLLLFKLDTKFADAKVEDYP